MLCHILTYMNCTVDELRGNSLPDLCLLLRLGAASAITAQQEQSNRGAGAGATMLHNYFRET